MLLSLIWRQIDCCGFKGFSSLCCIVLRKTYDLMLRLLINCQQLLCTYSKLLMKVRTGTNKILRIWSCCTVCLKKESTCSLNGETVRTAVAASQVCCTYCRETEMHWSRGRLRCSVAYLRWSVRPSQVKPKKSLIAYPLTPSHTMHTWLRPPVSVDPTWFLESKLRGPAPPAHSDFLPVDDNRGIKCAVPDQITNPRVICVCFH